MKEIIATFRAGAPVTDSELKQLCHHYSRLSFLLGEHGELYELVKKDVNNEFGRVQDMYKARFGKEWYISAILRRKSTTF